MTVLPNRRRHALAAAVLFAAVGLAGCSGNTVTPPPNTISTGTAAAPAPAAAAKPSPTASGDAAFGSTVTFPEGVTLTVTYSGTVPATPGAAGAVNGRIAVFTVAVTNGSKQPVMGALMSYPTATFGAAGQHATAAFDAGQGIGEPLTTINPGESQTIKVGFNFPVTAPAPARLEFTPPSYAETPAIFKGTVQP
jgi:hypothetical protein